MRTFLLLAAMAVFAGCSKYQKVLKSEDLGYKYDMAVKYYNDGEYYKALALFEELIGLYTGMDKAEEIYYYYAYSNYYMEDYVMAGYYFKNFVKTYPSGNHAEECMFMGAYCYYLNSPVASLDQSNTVQAIDELQLFINRYPKSEKITQCNELIDVLREKLESKAYRIAKLYFNLGSYKASAVAFDNLIKDFPDTKYKEEAYFYILKANYLLAINSIESKKKERLEAAISAYNSFENFQPNLSGLGESGGVKGADKALAKEAETILGNSKKMLENISKQIN